MYTKDYWAAVCKEMGVKEAYIGKHVGDREAWNKAINEAFDKEVLADRRKGKRYRPEEEPEMEKRVAKAQKKQEAEEAAKQHVDGEQCEICQRVFGNKRQLAKHIHMAHNRGDEVFECRKGCLKQCKTRASRTLHEKTCKGSEEANVEAKKKRMRDGQQKIRDRERAAETLNAAATGIEVRAVRGAGVFPCPHCEWVGRNRAGLASHLRRHQ